MTAAWTTPAKDWSTSEVLTAALLDTHLRDNMDYLNQEFVAKLGQWTSFVPTWTQSATISKTVTYSRYIKIGRLVNWQFMLDPTSNGTAGNAVVLTLPVNCAQGGNLPVGNAFIFNATNNLVIVPVTSSATTLTFLNSGAGGTGSAGFYTAQVLSTHALQGCVTYESAA
jgi:hypothetical protein